MLTRLLKWIGYLNPGYKVPGDNIIDLHPVEDERQENVMTEEEFKDEQAYEELKEDSYSYEKIIDYHRYKPKHFGSHKSYLKEETPEPLIKDKGERHGSTYGGEAELW